MKDKLIKEYIDKITINDVISFGNKNGISLNNEEALLVLKYIKNDWRTIIYGNPNSILSDLKTHLGNKYIKIEQLYTYFKNKYKDLL